MLDLLLQTTPGIRPFSAYALCYIPLAAVVLGLIALFVMTDAHARRPYLRFNPFIAYERPPEELEARAPASGETPAGTLGPPPAGEPTVFVGEQGKIVSPVPDDGPTPDEMESRRAEEEIGEIPAVEKRFDTLTDKLNEPAGTDDDDPNRYK